MMRTPILALAVIFGVTFLSLPSFADAGKKIEVVENIVGKGGKKVDDIAAAGSRRALRAAKTSPAPAVPGPRAAADQTSPPLARDSRFAIAPPPNAVSKTAAKTHTLRGRLQAAGQGAGLPDSGPIRFIPEKGYNPSVPIRRGPNKGYVDKFENEWIFDTQKHEWDVTLSRTGKAQLGHFSKSGSHLNVSPEGKITH
jgi:Novel toxin 17